MLEGHRGNLLPQSPFGLFPAPSRLFFPLTPLLHQVQELEEHVVLFGGEGSSGFLLGQKVLHLGQKVLGNPVVGFGLGPHPFQRLARGLGEALDVNAPAGELGGQAHVLALFADGLAQFVLVHHHDGRSPGDAAFRVRPQVHPQHPGRTQSLGDEDGRVGVPQDDVDFLPVELPHDGLDAGAANPDARADGVDVGRDGRDGHLGAPARLPGDGPDFHFAPVDFRHLFFQKSAQEVGMRPGEGDLRAFGGFLDVQEQGPDAVVHVEPFAGDLLLLGESAFGPFFQAHDDFMGMHGLHHTGHDFPDQLAEVVVLHLTLELAQALLEHLTGRLGRDAPKIMGRHIHHDEVPDLHLGVDASGLSQADFHAGVPDLSHYLLLGQHPNLTLGQVEHHVHLLGRGRARGLAVGRGNGLFEGFHHQVRGQLTLFHQFVEGQEHLTSRHGILLGR